MMPKRRLLPLIWLREVLGFEDIILPSSMLTKEQALKHLIAKVTRCTRCGLYRSKTNYVFGTGNPYARIMFVGEAPGYEEDKQGIPFVGKAGILLTQILESLGIERVKDVYIANVVKCRPPHNRDPLKEEVKACFPYLESQIKIISPDIICALGRYAAHCLLLKEEPLNRLRGHVHKTKYGIDLLVTYHPAAILRNPSLGEAFRSDIEEVLRYSQQENCN